jgi:hypothetical protein
MARGRPQYHRGDYTWVQPRTCALERVTNADVRLMEAVDCILIGSIFNRKVYTTNKMFYDDDGQRFCLSKTARLDDA